MPAGVRTSEFLFKKKIIWYGSWEWVHQIGEEGDMELFTLRLKRVSLAVK